MYTRIFLLSALLGLVACVSALPGHPGRTTVINKPESVPNPVFCSDFDLNATVTNSGGTFDIQIFYSVELNAYRYDEPIHGFHQILDFNNLLSFSNVGTSCYRNFLAAKMSPLALPSVYKYVGTETKDGVQCNKFQAILLSIYEFDVWVDASNNNPVAVQYGRVGATSGLTSASVTSFNCGAQVQSDFIPPQACL